MLAKPTLPTRDDPSPESFDPTTLEPGQRTRARVGGQLYPGAIVDQYQVIRSLGRGGMGEVYLARDTRLGRKVALKVIHASHLRSQDARDRFLHEARTTAQFSHPHIVTVYGVGEYRSSPYLALEYLEGETLRQRMGGERLTVRAALRLGLAMAEALVEATRRGILHGDLKPENVLIPRDGRLRVLDFGLARQVGVGEASTRSSGQFSALTSSEPSLESSIDAHEEAQRELDEATQRGPGTPLYMAPEQWREGGRDGRREGVVGHGADVWALGIILFELVTGRHPCPSSALDDLRTWATGLEPVDSIQKWIEAPLELSTLIERCLAKSSHERPPASEVAETLERMIQQGYGNLSEEQSPFRGLLAFGERHASYFFGRETEIAALLERLREQPVLPIVGPSGAGKSSLVQAGIIPRLREQGPWTVLSMRPGRTPFYTLASRLLGERGSSLPAFTTSLEPGQTERAQGESGVSSAVASALSEPALSVPELDGKARQQLALELQQQPGRLSLLLQHLAEQEGGRVLLVVEQLEELQTLVDDGRVRLAFMQALCLAADDPLSPVRVIFTLRDDFLARLSHGAEAQEVLSRVFVLQSPEASALRELLIKPVEAVGYAYDDPTLVPELVEAVGNESTGLPLLQFAARMLWDRRDKQRRLLCRSAYDAMGGVVGALARHAENVLEGFSPAQLWVTRELLLRLVTSEGTRQGLPRDALQQGLDGLAGGVVDALIEARLLAVRRGTEEGSEGEIELAHESLIHTWSSLAQWIEDGKEELSFLGQLTQAAALWHKRGRRKEELWQGDALADALRMRSKCSSPLPVLGAEFLDAGARQAQERQRMQRWLRWAGAALLVTVAVLATVAALVSARREAEALQQRATSEQETASAALARGDVMEARARLRGALEVQDSTASRALWGRLEKEPLVWEKQLELGSGGFSLAFSPDGKMIAATAQKTLFFLDVETGAVLRSIRSEISSEKAIGFSPDGRFVHTFNSEARMRLWRVSDGTPRPIQGNVQVSTIAYSPEGRWLAVGSQNDIEVWDLNADAPPTLLTNVGHSNRLVFSADGKQLAAATHERKIRIWEVKTSLLRNTITTNTMIGGMQFSKDGRSIVTSESDNHVRIRDTKTGNVDEMVAIPSSFYLNIRPDGKIIVYDSSVSFIDLNLWDSISKSLQKKSIPNTYSTAISSRAFTADYGRFALGDEAGDVHLFTVDSGERSATLRGREGKVSAVIYSPDGKLLASRNVAGSLSLWNLSAIPESVKEVRQIQSRDPLAFSPDGIRLATGSKDGRIWLMNRRTGVIETTLQGHSRAITRLEFSTDGKLLVSSANDQTIRLWDILTLQPLNILPVDASGFTSMEFSPESEQLLVVSKRGVMSLWDARVGTKQWERFVAPSTASFTKDGRYIANWNDTDQLQLWEVQSGILKKQWELSNRTSDVTSTPQGIWVVRADGETISLRNETTAQQYTINIPGDPIEDVRFTPDGSHLLSIHDQSIRSWNVRTGKNSGNVPMEHNSLFLDFVRDGQSFIVTGDSGVAYLLDSVSGRQNAKIELPVSSSMRHFTADGTLFALNSIDETCLRLWDLLQNRPVWHTKALLQSPPRLLTHQGWIDWRSNPSDAAPPASAWRTALEQDARAVAESVDGKLLCVQTWDDGIVLWDRADDVLLHRYAVPKSDQVISVGDGCAVRTGEAVSLLLRDGTVKELEVEATTIAPHPPGLLVGTKDQVLALDASGKQVSVQAIPDTAAVVAALPTHWIVGFEHGGIRAYSRGEASAVPLEFVDAPPGAPSAVLEGPPGTVIVGYQSGLLEIRSLQDGTRLDQHWLRGPVLHLAIDQQTLYAASELGAHQVIPLEVYYRPYCALLQKVWESVPMVWENGRTVLQPPPTHHECRGE